MQVLITGATGFVGPYLIAELERVFGKDTLIIPTAPKAEASVCGRDVMSLDVTDEDAVEQVISNVRPTHIVHLAGISSPPLASADPKFSWKVNTSGTLGVAHAVLRRAPQCCLIFAGSGLVYGASAISGEQLSETSLLAPDSEYAASKAAADLALGALTSRGLKSVRLRLFNHTGPRQPEAFVVPSFAAQVARIEAGHLVPVIRVGNLEVARDFLDVRDVATAYALVILKSPQLSPGIILNIASGKPRSIRSVLDGLLALSRVPIEVDVDRSRFRPSDFPLYFGNPTAARRLLGWELRYGFDETLADVLAYWRQHFASP